MSTADLPKRAEIVVVGGGVLGASAAFHLRRLGREVMLLDRGPIGAETSSQGAGFLCSHRSSVSSTRLVAYSTEFYVHFEEETGYKVDLHMTGGLRVAVGADILATLRADAVIAREAGIDVAEATAADMARLVPSMDLSTAIGGTFVVREGYVTATRDAAIGMARAAAKHGAMVRTHVEVRNVLARDGGGFDLDTADGWVHADKVVLAANAGAWPLTRRMGGGPYPSYPMLHECAVYSLPADVPYGMPTVRIGERDLYIRYEAGGLMIGGVGQNVDGPPTSAEEAAFFLNRIESEPSEIRAARERARQFVPGIDQALCFREQRGLAMVAPDLEPVAGEWMPGIYVMSADLRGVQSGPGLGRLVAELVANGRSELYHSSYDPKRFAAIRDGRQMRDAARRGIRPKVPA